jgi:hypothetical protein
MAYTSFRIRRQDQIAAPDPNPFGSYVRGDDSTAPTGETRTTSDFALRADGFVTATGDQIVSAVFSATAVDYSTIKLGWSAFALTNPIVNESGDTNISEIVLVYSQTGAPETVADGTVLKTQTYLDDVWGYDHHDLQEGKWAYYSLFIHWNQNGTGPSGVNWYERVATLQELVPYDYGSTEEMWKRIPSYLRYADTTGVDADPEQLGRGQFQRFINIFGFEMDRTRTLINAVFTGYDPSLTESTSLDKLTSMLGLELTSKDIGISRIRQIIQDVGYYRLRKGTLNAASQYITAVSGCQVDVIENPTDPQYTFRVYAEKVNLVADSLFVIESGTKKWDFNSSSASCDYSKSGKVITVTNTDSASAQFSLISKVAVPVDPDTQYWNSLKVSGGGSIWGSQWSASATWDDWDTEEQTDSLMPVNLSPTERRVTLMPSSASTMAYPVIIYGLDAGETVNVSEWMVEPKTYGAFFNGDSDFGGFIYQNNFADYLWSDQQYASYSVYTTNRTRTHNAIEKLLPTLLPVNILVQGLDGYELIYDWIPGKE